MKIKQVICSAGRTGFYFDDQRAIKQGAGHDGFYYEGQALTAGFAEIRQAGEAISIQLLLEDGSIAYGDCAAVQYSGAGGRDPLFLAAEYIPFIEAEIAPVFVGAELHSFRELCQKLENIKYNGENLHTAIRYGFSQALLDAVAKSKRQMMCDVVAAEYGCELSTVEIPIFSQSGDNRYENVDKMIIKHVDVLPHALFNNVAEKLGSQGEKLKEYLQWLKNRIMNKRYEADYKPILHIDCYGTIGQVFGCANFAAMADYLAELEEIARPFKLRIEGPMDADGRDEQMRCLAGLTKVLDERGIAVELVADEWCNTLEDIKLFADNRAGHMIQIKTPDLGSIHNTIEAVLYCQAKGIGAYQGGTCNETDRSAQVCVHLAMATKPVQILAKPGMGVDEGFMIAYNEMQRILAFHK